MITLTKLNDNPIVVNAELIETIETTPDTLMTLTNGKKILVKEPAEEVVEMVIAYRQRTLKDLVYFRGEEESE